MTRAGPDLSRFDYAALARLPDGHALEFAFWSPLAETEALLEWLSPAATDGETAVLALCDARQQTWRAALMRGDVVEAIVFTAAEPVVVSRSHVAQLLTSRAATPAARAGLLAGRPGRGARDRGAIVCACLDVGRNDIARAVASGARDVDAVGAMTGAGTNCGSCRAEIRGLIERHAAGRAANETARDASDEPHPLVAE